jgi:hypothetical protein
MWDIIHYSHVSTNCPDEQVLVLILDGGIRTGPCWISPLLLLDTSKAMNPKSCYTCLKAEDILKSTHGLIDQLINLCSKYTGAISPYPMLLIHHREVLVMITKDYNPIEVFITRNRLLPLSSQTR